MSLARLSIQEAKKKLDAKEISAVELTQDVLSSIKERDSSIHAYLEVFDDVIEQAKEADRLRDEGKTGKLLGIPLAIKDNILIEGRKVSAASLILENYKASYDATVIKKLKEEGALFIGRANMDEFAMGGSTEHSAYGITRNPHDESRVPGGSSGGSAAAVSMGGALGALGSDTGGSVRQPASFCGLVGLKPTYGSVSRYGLIAMGSSLDQIGPITKTVSDAELIHSIIAVPDPFDSTSLPLSLRSEKLFPDSPVIGVPRDFLKSGGKGIDSEVLLNFEESLKRFESIGFTVKDIELPNTHYSLPAYYIVMPAEASTNLARFDGVRYGLLKEGKDLLEDYLKTRGEGFGAEVRRRILLGTYVLSAGYYDAYYNKAVAARKLIATDFVNAFEGVHLVMTPTTPAPAFRIGEKDKDPLTMYLEDIFTIPANITGLPALSVPSGFVEREGKKLPLGIQLMSPFYRENWLFKAGKKFLNEHA